MIEDEEEERTFNERLEEGFDLSSDEDKDEVPDSYKKRRVCIPDLIQLRRNLCLWEYWWKKELKVEENP